MCRKNLLPGVAALGFGAGVLFGLMLESSLILLIVGCGAICGGFWLLRGRC